MMILIQQFRALWQRSRWGRSSRKKGGARAFVKAGWGKRKGAASVRENQRSSKNMVRLSLQSFVLGRGSAIGFVIGAITNALKPTSKSFGKRSYGYRSETWFCPGWSARLWASFSKKQEKSSSGTIIHVHFLDDITFFLTNILNYLRFYYLQFLAFYSNFLFFLAFWHSRFTRQRLYFRQSKTCKYRFSQRSFVKFYQYTYTNKTTSNAHTCLFQNALELTWLPTLIIIIQLHVHLPLKSLSYFYERTLIKS